MIPRPNSLCSEPGTSDPFLKGNVMKKKRNNPCEKAQSLIIRALENYFECHGGFVASHPWKCILFCLCLFALSLSGFVRYRREDTQIKLWVPSNSASRINFEWLNEKYPSDFRFAFVIVEAENVLNPNVVRAMYSMRKRVDDIVTKYGDSWSHICQRLPIVKAPNFLSLIFDKKRKKRDILEEKEAEEEFFSFSDDFFGEEEEYDDYDADVSFAEKMSVEQYPQPYCKFVEKMPQACFEMSILELWGNQGQYDSLTESDMDSLTSDDVIRVINDRNTSGIFLTERNFTELLGGISRDPLTGKIIGAKATKLIWFFKMNVTEALRNPVPQRGEIVDRRTFEFEGDLTAEVLNDTDFPEGMRAFPHLRRSFSDVAGSTILGDVRMLGFGYMIVFVYVLIMLGKFNCVEQRIWLAVAGIISVVLGIIISMGLCSGLGIFTTPMHNIIPFLLLGIGIDDMFVIVQCWNTLDEEEKCLPAKKKFGYTMRHAGVAITVTSITDIIAFAIGGMSVLPALQAFCLYASVGIAIIYFLQTTFFLAWMVIDEKRISARRNGCLPCITFKRQKDGDSDEDIIDDHAQLLSTRFFRFWGRLLTVKIMKLIVITMTLSITGVCVYGNLLLEQKFDPSWFLPEGSYLSEWFRANEEMFPSQGGETVIVHVYNVDISENFFEIQRLIRHLESQTDIVDKVDSWTTEYMAYADRHGFASGTLYERINQFLFSPVGGKYRNKFRTMEGVEDFHCGGSTVDFFKSNDSIWNFEVKHKVLKTDAKITIPAMNRIKSIVDSVNLTSGKIFPMSHMYSLWETDEVISKELYKNVVFASIAVFLTTFIVISDFLASFLVLVCVMLTVGDVSGTMHFWGLTIDTVSCNILVISIGLCVDYSAHIAHRFLSEPGESRDGRIISAVGNIGPAVLNGGMSTFLAFVLLGSSKSHVFITFFKIFFLVVIYGLFHGLVLLPVLLSLVGSKSHRVRSRSVSEHNKESVNMDDIIKQNAS